MAGFIENPRRAPRVAVHLPVEIGYGSALWPGLTDDIGPAGCLLLAGRPLAERTPLSLVLPRTESLERLTVGGSVVWNRGRSSGVRFVPGEATADVDAWFHRLVGQKPALHAAVIRSRSRLALDARLSLAPGPPRPGPPPSLDEARVLAQVRDGITVGLVALHARLPPDRFARALFALLERGVLTAPLPAAEARGRAALHEQRIAEDIALGSRER